MSGKRLAGSLTLARSWYLVIGAGSLLITGGVIIGDFSPGSVVDFPNLAAGLAVGMLAIGAAAWVQARSTVRAAVAWIGIAARVALFALLFWIAATTARDAIWLAGVPTVLAAAAAVRMGLARMEAKPWGRLYARRVRRQPPPGSLLVRFGAGWRGCSIGLVGPAALNHRDARENCACDR